MYKIEYMALVLNIYRILTLYNLAYNLFIFTILFGLSESSKIILFKVAENVFLCSLS